MLGLESAQQRVAMGEVLYADWLVALTVSSPVNLQFMLATMLPRQAASVMGSALRPMPSSMSVSWLAASAHTRATRPLRISHRMYRMGRTTVHHTGR